MTNPPDKPLQTHDCMPVESHPRRADTIPAPGLSGVQVVITRSTSRLYALPANLPCPEYELCLAPFHCINLPACPAALWTLE